MKNEKYLGIASEKWIFLFSTVITFSICGIWHGEGANFLIWGLLFGIYLSYSVWTAGLNKSIRKTLHISKKTFIFKTYKIIVTFLLVCFAFVFFRAESLTDALSIIRRVFTNQGPLFISDKAQFFYSIFGIFLLILVELYQEFGKIKLPYLSKYWFKDQIIYATLIILILLFGVFDGGQFIYFQF